MKVLSLTEPYTTLIKEKTKRIETRSWKTSYRGELYIHASNTKVPKEYKENKELMNLVKNKDYPYGQIICKANLIDCIKMTKDWIEKIKKENNEEYLCGIYEEGRYAWILEDIEVLSHPIYTNGNLSVWTFDEEYMKKQLEKILNKNKTLMELLKRLEQYQKDNPDFKNYYVGAGAINQTVFNYFHKYPVEQNISDYDIVYYDKDTSYEKEDKIIKDLENRLKDLKVKTDIKNECRVPIWKKEKYNQEIKPYLSIEEAISRWSTTITCLGVRLQQGKIKIYAPYGLEDLFRLIIRPVKIDVTRKDYEEKAKKWKQKWPKLTVISWNGVTNNENCDKIAPRKEINDEK